MSTIHSPEPYSTSLVELDPIALRASPPIEPPDDDIDEDEDNGEQAILLRRTVAAIYRYKWFIALAGVLSAAAGFQIKGRYSPEYEVEGRVWIAPTAGDGGGSSRDGPVRAAAILPSNSWSDLLASYAVIGGAVRELHLYVHAANPQDDKLFASADVTERVRPGGYTLRVDPTGTQYQVVTGPKKEERIVEQGALGDSVGRSIGLLWLPDKVTLLAERSITFSLTTPRAAAQSVQGSVRAVLPWQGNIMRVYVTRASGWQANQIANALLRQLVRTADEFKRRNVTEVRKSIDTQLAFAGRALEEADSALERFRRETITLPPAQTGPQAAPQATEYFRLKLALETATHQRAALETTLDDIKAGKLDVQALWQVLPPDGATQDIGALLQEYSKKQALLRNDLLAFTEDYQGVKETRAAIAQLRDQAIPSMVSTMIEQLRRREADLQEQVNGESASLQTIPPRMVEEVRLTREVDARRQLFDMLQRRAEEARLAELSIEPDLMILDKPNMPDYPISNKGRQMFLVVAVGGFGAAVVFALLLDRLDKRLRYVQQIVPRLKLRVLAAVPRAQRRSKPDPLNVAQLVEAFRSLRLNVTYACAQTRGLKLAITSAAPSEGKSFVSANLALAFAEAGFRTVLIDGDVRRGGLHATFHVDRRPGLVDVLRGVAPLTDSLAPTSHAKLSLLPCGTRDMAAPELLSSAAFLQLVQLLQGRYDVVLIDTPPLAAGMDPHALCAAAGNALFVVRIAHTDGAIARQKLDVLGRLPVRIIGVAANDVSHSLGLKDEYSYLPTYSIAEEDGVMTTAVRVVY